MKIVLILGVVLFAFLAFLLLFDVLTIDQAKSGAFKIALGACIVVLAGAFIYLIAGKKAS